ncbi:Outer membrane lipoprotein omp16 precursor [Thioalkalivibrio nitratireducens DSM 14787]|uniref:Outer membrane lipoprotein omp16 n=1 Tax=Thioalkalivibrio nitratireducens (strain DSM 14787 / UNIQEM 213 / ALEN2) TaxID=1255043 RepID=L0DSY9_THIND|nr:Outer membrane lipoprotein omp16 precursor [Thioalkalivibrio nitratireducens DSM 14787]
MTGCTTIDPYTGEERVSRTTIGAGIGAAAGAVLGSVTSSRNRTQRAMIGAGIGALAGGAIGNYMDRQEEELRQQLQGTGVSVTRVGDNLVLNMPGHITFDVDRTEIKPEFQSVLDSVVLVLNRYEKTGIEVAGHTDSTGRVEYNMDLSERRARSVAHAMTIRGVNPVRIATIGFGPHQPIASNETAEGRTLNRRVELTLFPLTTG